MQVTTVSPPRAEGRRPTAPGSALPLTMAALLFVGSLATAGDAPSRPIDFNREIRPILSNVCSQCHGPDAKKRKGVNKPLRLDVEEGAFADLGGYTAIVRGKPEESELIQRVISQDPLEVMPPPSHGKKLTPREIERLTEWVRQGAPYARHWSYVKPTRPDLPAVRDASWPKSAIDYFILARLEREGLKPSPEADRYTLIRRLSLDLTGLPPTLDEVDRFVKDTSPDAYRKLVDRQLEKPSYGEHWARMWLDLARYADSSGYADDPPRTIWAYRDYVIKAFNANKPFDRFTIEQLAGDLLPGADEAALVATAFHRNTQTNNEGGTNDEEFRSVAVVDRVNTTMAVWMGTTLACAQCHDHKYDPLSQAEYFKFYAFFNNTEDADRGNEAPTLPLYGDEQKQQKSAWEAEIPTLEKTLRTPSPELLSGQARWEEGLAADLSWKALKPSTTTARSGAKVTPQDDQSVLVESKDNTDVYTVKLPLGGARLTAIRLETLPDESLPAKGPGHASGNFVVSRVLGTVVPPGGAKPAGRYVRVEIPGKQKILSLAEVQVFSGSDNVARSGQARQSSTDYGGDAARAVDGNTDGRYNEANSTTHTAISDDPWWEVDLKSARPVDRIAIWNRTDNGTSERLVNFRVSLLDEKRQPVWTQMVAAPPKPSAEWSPSGDRALAFAAATADYSQASFDAASVLNNTTPATKGWAVGGQAGRAHALTLLLKTPVEAETGATLALSIEQLSGFERHTIGRFRVSVTDDPRAGEIVRVPAAVLAILKTAAPQRTEAQRQELTRYYLAEVAPELKGTRERLATVKTQLSAMKPATTVPIFRELAGAARRKTQIQHRGNFLDLGAEVTEGVPAVFPPLPAGAPKDRLTLARWLVSEDNPLTGRVIANRYWEQLFGLGIVQTSEEFGSQGDLPTHPELLDWLATELVRQRWDLKEFLRLLVTSATYRQDSRVTPEQVLRDPDNHLLSYGARFRLSAETIRDQALFVSGLLSAKSYGPPVKPPQPASGLNAAFGSGIDWQTSAGADRYRRGLYTTWRRSNPYPSMATFDAPNREVCIVRRSRTNTPLQALVTLNDPVYVEAAQALARKMAAGGATTADKAGYGFRLCLARPATASELSRLTRLYESAREAFAKDAARAKQLATEPLGPLPEGADAADLAAWTVVGNVLLNIDEMLMKR